MSFTHAAIDEARRRCVDYSYLLQAPNFVGTFDSFMSRFVVGPLWRQREGAWPEIHETWDALPEGNFEIWRRDSKIPWQFQLSWFEYDINGNMRFASTRVPGDKQHLLRGVTPDTINQANRQATLQSQKLASAGLVDCGGVRHRLWQYLDDDVIGGMLAELLEARFGEIIVDEVQDCGKEEVRLLKFIKDSGINLILVGDVEQSIFGFRGGNPALLANLRSLIPSNIPLTANFRSSPAICGLVSALRVSGSQDVAVGPYKDCLDGIQVIPFKKEVETKEKLKKLLAQMNLSNDDVVVVAHSASDALKHAGASLVSQSASGKLLARLARDSSDARNPQLAAQERARALNRFCRGIRTLSREDNRFRTYAAFCESVAITYKDFRDGCARLAFRCDLASMDAREYRREVVQGLTDLGWNAWIDFRKLQGVSDTQWNNRQIPSQERCLQKLDNSFLQRSPIQGGCFGSFKVQAWRRVVGRRMLACWHCS